MCPQEAPQLVGVIIHQLVWGLLSLGLGALLIKLGRVLRPAPRPPPLLPGMSLVPRMARQRVWLRLEGLVRTLARSAGAALIALGVLIGIAPLALAINLVASPLLLALGW